MNSLNRYLALVKFDFKVEAERAEVEKLACLEKSSLPTSIETCRAFTFSGYVRDKKQAKRLHDCVYMAFNDSTTHGTIAHESLHAVQYMFDKLGGERPTEPMPWQLISELECNFLGLFVNYATDFCLKNGVVVNNAYDEVHTPAIKPEDMPLTND